MGASEYLNSYQEPLPSITPSLLNSSWQGGTLPARNSFAATWQFKEQHDVFITGRSSKVHRTLLCHSVQLVSARAAPGAVAVPLTAPVAAVQPHELPHALHFGIMHERILRFVDKIVR